MPAAERVATSILRIGGNGRHRGPMPVMSLMREVEKGLSVTVLDEVARAVAPGDGAFASRIIPKATLSRRRKAFALADGDTAVLTPEEGGRVARVAEVWVSAIDVWGGEEAARAFLFRPHPLLEGQRPMDVVLASEYGRPVVLDILGGLKHGTAV
ncbi:MAG: antitoxin Xre/MbcA/ParS toxin-binding domain-containing protein [Janthinobacterium lividum]